MQYSYDSTPTLYLVPTPIGNLDDITKRSLDTLISVDMILCEDTRTTSQLLNKYKIKNKLISCHKFNEEKIKENIIEKLKLGMNLALVTDQGSPIISDPGYIIADYVIKNGFNVVALPGATAFTPALMTSGLSADHFLYYGFLNNKESKRKKELESLKDIEFTMIFYEAPHRIEKTLKDMLEIFGNRNISIAREISKIHEEILRGTISECLDALKTIKGEFVIVVEGNKEKTNYNVLSIYEHVKLYVKDNIKEMDAIKKVAKERNIPKSDIYIKYISEKEKIENKEN